MGMQNHAAAPDGRELYMWAVRRPGMVGMNYDETDKVWDWKDLRTKKSLEELDIMPKAIMYVHMCVCVCVQPVCMANHILLNSPRPHFFSPSREGHIPANILELVCKIDKEEKLITTFLPIRYGHCMSICLTHLLFVQVTHETPSIW